jgi:hypothetical protein
MDTNIASRVNIFLNNEKIRTHLVNFRYPICFALFILILPQIRPAFLLPAFLVSLLGELIQVWSFASLDKNRSLACRGPYSLTRNPVYIGRFLLLLGVVLAASEIWIIIVFMIIYYFYVTNRVRREERRLLKIFQEEYQSYCSKVKRFTPSFKSANVTSIMYFKLNLFLKNSGHLNLFGFFSILYYMFSYFSDQSFIKNYTIFEYK